MENKIVLSIVFPTFERDVTIELALKSMLANIPVDIQEFIEILVFDNNSSDFTQEKVENTIAQNPQIKNFKFIKNETNLGFDLNHYKAYTTATGAFIWFCSDRYIYNVNVKTIVDIIRTTDNIGAITFSTLFKKRGNIPVNPDAVDTIDKMYDTTSLSSLNPSFKEYNQTRCYEVSNTSLIKENINHYKTSSLVANVSDSIVKIYKETDWLERLKQYDGTFMLVISTLIKPYSDFQKNTIVINLPYFTKPFRRINIKTGRHLNRMVCYGYIMQQQDFQFIGSKKFITRLQLNALLNLRLHTITSKGIINTIEVADIFKFCHYSNYKIPFLLRIWMNFFRVNYLPHFMLKPIILINKIIFKLYEFFPGNKE